MSSPTHGFNFGLPASQSLAVLLLVSSQGSAVCVCVCVYAFVCHFVQWFYDIAPWVHCTRTVGALTPFIPRMHVFKHWWTQGGVGWGLPSLAEKVPSWMPVWWMQHDEMPSQVPFQWAKHSEVPSWHDFLRAVAPPCTTGALYTIFAPVCLHLMFMSEMVTSLWAQVQVKSRVLKWLRGSFKYFWNSLMIPLMILNFL